MSRSKNASNADNQQERLAGWVVGFTDGEGCFSVGFVAQRDRQEAGRIRRGYKTGYQPFHEFSVTQGESSLSVLKNLQSFFKVGKVYPNKRYDNHNEHLYRYVVRKRQDLIDVIIPFFEKYKLHTAKRKSFIKFARCVRLLHKGVHMKTGGFIKIALVARQMNRKKSGKNLARILRDYTPNSKSMEKI